MTAADTQGHDDGDLLVVLADVAGRRCAIPVDRVAEIHPAVLPTPLPGAPEVITGMINRRGEPTPVMDLRRRFALPQRGVLPEDRLVAVRSADRTVALLVDAVVDVVTVPRRDVDQAATPASRDRAVSGVALLPDGLALIVDVDAFLSSHELLALDRAIAAAARARM